eukprot:CAMPEP_0171096722 /NCGR_PEP_ID=MMETSP0766_2-20121228/45703_1 /TAXON_ID=439317 /ORGANISM="Gambierdiscus australes, Strain CAWD 149" /LENGTH=129 /DNA_ID=CAMNT_0011555769 /DNA_START=65 /DNA_END=451 /DNA_ORIENTATION=-
MASFSLAALMAAVAAVLAAQAATAHEATQASSNPLFSAEACKEMFERMRSLGSPVPPNEFVTGCTEVCLKIKEMKEYWGPGEEAALLVSKAKPLAAFGLARRPSLLRPLGADSGATVTSAPLQFPSVCS